MEDELPPIPCYGRPSDEQRSLMLEILKTNVDLARGQLTGYHSRKYHEECWSDIAFKLNSCNPCHSKSKEKWQKTWLDWRRFVRQKASKIRVHQRNKKGPAPKRLTELEEDVLELAGEGNVDRVPLSNDEEDDVPSSSNKTGISQRDTDWREEPIPKRYKKVPTPNIVSLHQESNHLLKTINESLSNMASSMSAMQSTVSTMGTSMTAMVSVMSKIADAMQKKPND